MIQFKFDKKSFRQARSNVDYMMEQVKRRAMKDALMKAAQPGLKAARANVRRRSGALRKSLIKKGKTYRHSGSAFVIVGPSRGASGEFEGKKIRPIKYAHLVEFGHRKRGGGFVAPRPFLRPAFESSKGEIKRIYTKEIVPAVERHAVRAARRRARR